jgi:hypothetical protein
VLKDQLTVWQRAVIAEQKSAEGIVLKSQEGPNGWESKVGYEERLYCTRPGETVSNEWLNKTRL